jgi:hypothetical protein
VKYALARPFTPATPVQIRLGTPSDSNGLTALAALNISFQTVSTANFNPLRWNPQRVIFLSEIEGGSKTRLSDLITDIVWETETLIRHARAGNMTRKHNQHSSPQNSTYGDGIRSSGRVFIGQYLQSKSVPFSQPGYRSRSIAEILNSLP